MQIKVNDGKKRVVITGVGPITPVGIGKEEFWKNSLEGKSGAELNTFSWFDPEKYNSHVCATVKDFDHTKYGLKRKSLTLDRVALFALAGTYLALEDAGIDFTASRGKAEIKNLDLDLGCIIISTGIGGLNTMTEEYKKYINREKMNKFVVSKIMSNAPSSQVSIMYGIKGEVWPVQTACASGTMAGGSMFRLISSSEYKWGIFGGIESCFGHDGYGFTGFDVIPEGALSKSYNQDPKKASRSFDKNRDGFVLAEGAGILFAEELEHALARNARIYAEIIGYDANSDAYSIMAPDPEAKQITKLMKNLLKKSNIKKPEEIQYFNTHGTSTVPNDKIETAALKKVFGDHSYKLALTATKSRIGHSIAAAGAIEAIETVLSIERQIVLPTINYETPDPECDLNYTPNKPIEHKIENAISTSYGFGGHNAGLAFSKY